MATSHSRCILCLDIDCFFAQVLLKDKPELFGKPVAIKQKYIVVTANYEARKFGVRKLMPILEAIRLHPELIILDGSDLTPFRAAGSQLFQVTKMTLGNIAVERKGFDEVYADITEPCCTYPKSLEIDDKNEIYLLLAAGSEIAHELRREIKTRLGFTSCAGVSTSKFAAKLASNFNKPDLQTTFLPDTPEYVDYFHQLKLRDLPGFGYASSRLLKQKGVYQQISSCKELLKLQEKELTTLLDGDIQFSRTLLEFANGIDKREVEPMIVLTQQLSREETKLPHPTTLSSLKSRISDLVHPLFELIQARYDDSLEWPSLIKLSIKFRNEQGRKSKSRRLAEPLVDVDVLARVAEELCNEFLLPNLIPAATHVNLGVSEFGKDVEEQEVGESRVKKPRNTIGIYFKS